MAELRQDPVTRDWVIINPERALRPHDADEAESHCPFCAGNEHLTPKTVDAILDSNGNWLVRSVPNRFPALSHEQGFVWQHENTKGLRLLPGYGFHEVIVESPDHGETLATMPTHQVRHVLQMYLRRFRALASCDKLVRQVVLFRNQGARAGTSLAHPHAQIIAIPVVSPEIRWRLSGEVEFFDTTGVCGLCHVLEKERATSERVVMAGEHFLTLAPYASRVPYHLQIIPRRHTPTFPEISELEIEALAVHLGKTLAALHWVLHEPSYNLVVVTPPQDQIHQHANHWFIDVLPRLSEPAGFELGSRIVINTQTPERVAAELRARI